MTDRANISDTGNFNYHFGKLVGHYVRKEGEIYELTRSGRQAMTAVMAGNVTERPTFDPVTIEKSCPYCGAGIELYHNADRLRVMCSSCPGVFDGEWEQLPGTDRPRGTLSTFPFPPAGLRDRDPETVLKAALTRLVSRLQDMANGVCPDCAGPVESTVEVCGDHGDGVCEACGSRFAGIVSYRCETCRTTDGGILVVAALADARVQNYVRDHGHDLLDPMWETAALFITPEERVHSVDPVDYETIWNLDGERLSIRIDGTASVTAVERG